MRTIELQHILLVLTLAFERGHAKFAWDQTATSADERIKPALLPRTDTGPLPAPPSARAGMTIGMSRLAQRAQSLDAVVEQRPGFDLEPASNARNVVDRDVAFGPLYPAEIRAVDAALMGQAAALSLGRG